MNKGYVLDGLITGSIWIGTRLAQRLGLHTRYFTSICKHEYNANANINLVGGIVIVEIPNQVQELINDGYISVKINKDEVINNDDFDYVYELTDKTRIGFYK